MFSVGIIGYGKLGKALAEAFSELNILRWIVDRDNDKFYNFKDKNVKTFDSLDLIDYLPDYIFIVVNDANIEIVSKELAEKFRENLKNTTVIHCSGALGLNVLDDCKLFAKNIASIHPYQTFYNPSKELFDCAWSYNSLKESDEFADLIKLLGGNLFQLDDKDKTLYHLSAVIASNITTILMSSSKEILSRINLPAGKFIAPIIETTVKNNIKSFENNEEMPLTGPLARGDINTIKEHFRVLENYPHLFKEYVLILQYSLEHLKNSGKIDSSKFEELFDLIDSITKNL